MESLLGGKFQMVKEFKNFEEIEQHIKTIRKIIRVRKPGNTNQIGINSVEIWNRRLQ